MTQGEGSLLYPGILLVSSVSQALSYTWYDRRMLMAAHTERRRVRVSATLDPQLAQAIDAYVAAHVGADRSAVINDALRLWYARQQEEAMAAQYAADAERPPDDEWAAWQAIRRAASHRRLARREEA